jgi:hypothetical protein
MAVAATGEGESPDSWTRQRWQSGASCRSPKPEGGVQHDMKKCILSIFRERDTRDARLNNIMAEICRKTHWSRVQNGQNETAAHAQLTHTLFFSGRKENPPLFTLWARGVARERYYGQRRNSTGNTPSSHGWDSLYRWVVTMPLNTETKQALDRRALICRRIITVRSHGQAYGHNSSRDGLSSLSVNLSCCVAILMIILLSFQSISKKYKCCHSKMS